MITLEDYFGPRWGHEEANAEEIQCNARSLLVRVNNLLAAASAAGVYGRWVNPHTKTCVSGSKGGSGDGGFRLSNSATGSPTSAHKRAYAVDVYDPTGALDRWITDDILATYRLYREHPDDTPTWCHLQIPAPKSGRRTFKP